MSLRVAKAFTTRRRNVSTITSLQAQARSHRGRPRRGATPPVDVAISVTETGELADLAFSLPQPCRGRRSLEYLSRTLSASVVEEKVFITVPGDNGDSVLQGKGNLELDGFGRIIGLEIS